tara:strand:+ start:520 stop:747 length:228 start_codon:yes stop_codon:yes gene_type:complete
MRKGIVTREQKISATIIDLLADMRLDLDMIGLYFGKYARTVIYNRLAHIYEVAKYHRENEDSEEAHAEYIKNINA